MTSKEAAKILSEIWGVDYHYCLTEREACAVDMAIEALDEHGRWIDKVPTADVQEVKHGRWGVLLSFPPQYRCSECLTITDFAYAYCPWCGAKMDSYYGKENE